MADYAKQKFFEAVFALVGDGDVQMRLTYAANELAVLQAGELPAAMRNDFAALRRELMSQPLSNDAGFVPRNIDRGESNRLAQTILGMYVELSALSPQDR